ncbi:MAG: murein hydrolase activator EnvC family protein [Sphingomonadales bacterium]
MARTTSCAAALVLLFTASTRTAEAPTEELNRIEKEIEKSKETKRGLDASAAKLADEVGDLTTRLIATANRIQTQEDQVGMVEKRLAGLAETEKVKSRELETRTRQLSHSLAALQRLSRQPNLLLVGRPATTVDSLRTADLLTSLVPELQDRAAVLGEALAALERLRADIEVEQGRLVMGLQGLGQERTRIDALLEQKAASETEVQKAAKAEQRRLEKLTRQAVDLRALIARLEAEETSDRKGEVVALPPSGGQPFSSVRGSLLLPARGRLVQRFKQPDTGGRPSRGIAIETRNGAQVVTPYDGKIVFAGQFRNYGQLLIISHGEGYHTVLVGMSRIDGVVGQWLLTGEPVGLMGGTDASDPPGKKPMLYVELRRNGNPINPMVWLTVSERKVSG